MMDTNYNTDVWPHGHILLQTPNAKGIRYALKYALKQQFGVAKSEGTNRLPKSENWAASFFRMSKKPPIGLPYLTKICDDAERGSYVYPSIKLRVPTIDGYWQPSGLLEQYFWTVCTISTRVFGAILAGTLRSGRLLSTNTRVVCLMSI